jgi:hypothetical protein
MTIAPISSKKCASPVAWASVTLPFWRALNAVASGSSWTIDITPRRRWASVASGRCSGCIRPWLTAR